MVLPLFSSPTRRILSFWVREKRERSLVRRRPMGEKRGGREGRKKGGVRIKGKGKKIVVDKVLKKVFFIDIAVVFRVHCSKLPTELQWCSATCHPYRPRIFVRFSKSFAYHRFSTQPFRIRCPFHLRARGAGWSCRCSRARRDRSRVSGCGRRGSGVW